LENCRQSKSLRVGESQPWKLEEREKMSSPKLFDNQNKVQAWYAKFLLEIDLQISLRKNRSKIKLED
jgi:hypothetical protein